MRHQYCASSVFADAIPEFEPLVRLDVSGIILVAELPRSETLLESLCLRCGAVLVGTADIERPQIPSACGGA